MQVYVDTHQGHPAFLRCVLSVHVLETLFTFPKLFPKEVESGLLEVVSPSQYYYPNFTSIKETFGDSKDRTKPAMILEDDVIANIDYYNAMRSYVVQQESKTWLYLEFSHLGFIGKLFRTRDLPMIVRFFLMFHKDKPIDWLLDHILWVKVCHPEKDAKDCDKEKARLKPRYTPSLFQHVGLHSSLPGKTQTLKDKNFGKQRLFSPHQNPKAQIGSSLKHYQQHSLERAYQGQDFFWALTPTKGDYILFNFSQPTYVTRSAQGLLGMSGGVLCQGGLQLTPPGELLPDPGRGWGHGLRVGNVHRGASTSIVDRGGGTSIVNAAARSYGHKVCGACRGSNP
uniref:Alpha-1,3-mannosyl-glycoprotein 4-beta-N-acetylglucosaminyltransferase B n=1 Tax=Periophthalmus magnuspinnatus TaxID=409849 RepID=A0A3B4BDF2_9GOBI